MAATTDYDAPRRSTLEEAETDSLEVLTGCMLEPAAVAANAEEPMQFERQGYFRRDRDSAPGRPVFIRTVGLRDTFAKTLGSGGATTSA